MSEPIWKLTVRNPLQEVDVVRRDWPDGRQESCLVTTKEYLKWIEVGNTPLPAEENT
jgi:hypothetical protein